MVSGPFTYLPGSSRVREWPVWALRRWLIAFIASVTAVYLCAIGAAAANVSLHLGDLALFAALLACSAVTVELTRRSGENAGVIKDVYGVWELPAAILLPPLYALLAPVLRIVLAQWRIRQIPIHRRALTAAAIGLSYGVVSLLFHTLVPSIGTLLNRPGGDVALWVLAVAAAAAVQWLVNYSLVITAIKGADPTVSIRTTLLGRETLENDIAELSVGVLVTISVAISWIALAFAVPLVTLLQRSSRHKQLVTASRLDSKTGLLNAGTWEREAASEVARAIRTHTPLAVALIDADHFKVVNDTYGHVAGDAALKSIAQTLRTFLRDYDLVGRFGGEEFVLLLPQTTPAAAYRIAQRLREHISATPIPAGDDPEVPPLRLTVSIGVAALSEQGGQVTDLLAAADTALYRAKAAGRDQVWMLTDTATIGASGRAAPSGPQQLGDG
ncbi:MAG: GGDEF domain-containing protein [Actinobacteria bacterium]|nr:GGDEF domain-containing protein [Actinomycetota bacterium]